MNSFKGLPNMKTRYVLSGLIFLLVSVLIGSFIPLIIKTCYLPSWNIDFHSRISQLFWIYLLALLSLYIFISFFIGIGNTKATYFRLLNTPIHISCFSYSRLFGVLGGCLWLYLNFINDINFFLFEDLYKNSLNIFLKNYRIHIIVFSLISISSVIKIKYLNSLLWKKESSHNNSQKDFLDENAPIPNEELLNIFEDISKKINQTINSQLITFGANIIALSGINGTGKTTLLKKFQKEWIKARTRSYSKIDIALNTPSEEESIKAIYNGISKEIFKYHVPSIFLNPTKSFHELRETKFKSFGFELKIGDWLNNIYSSTWEDEVKKLLEITNSEFLYIIDEFDRLKTSTRRSIAEALFRLKQINKLRIIVAVTPNNIENMLPSSTEAYTSNVFSHIITLPVLNGDKWYLLFYWIMDELDRSLNDFKYFSPFKFCKIDIETINGSKRFKELMYYIMPLLIIPRDFKTFGRLLREYFNNKVDDFFLPEEILILAAIQSSFPQILDYLDESRDIILNDDEKQRLLYCLSPNKGNNKPKEPNKSDETNTLAISFNKWIKSNNKNQFPSYKKKVIGECLDFFHSKSILRDAKQPNLLPILSHLGYMYLVYGHTIPIWYRKNEIFNVLKEPKKLIDNLMFDRERFASLEIILKTITENIVDIKNNLNNEIWNYYINFLIALNYNIPLVDKNQVASMFYRGIAKELNKRDISHLPLIGKLYNMINMLPHYAIFSISADYFDSNHSYDQIFHLQNPTINITLLIKYREYLKYLLKNRYPIFNSQEIKIKEFINIWKIADNMMNEYKGYEQYPSLSNYIKKECQNKKMWDNLIIACFHVGRSTRHKGVFNELFLDFNSYFQDAVVWLRLLDKHGISSNDEYLEKLVEEANIIKTKNRLYNYWELIKNRIKKKNNKKILFKRCIIKKGQA